MPLRSPCHTCDHQEENKNKFLACLTCKSRLEYIAELEGWDKRKLEAAWEELRTSFMRRKAKYCSTPGCQGLQIAKGLCRRCYMRERYLRLYGKESTIANAPQILHIYIKSHEDGSITFDLVKAISEYEHRSISAQALEFVQMGIIQWLHEHNLDMV